MGFCAMLYLSPLVIIPLPSPSPPTLSLLESRQERNLIVPPHSASEISWGYILPSLSFFPLSSSPLFFSPSPSFQHLAYHNKYINIREGKNERKVAFPYIVLSPLLLSSLASLSHLSLPLQFPYYYNKYVNMREEGVLYLFLHFFLNFPPSFSSFCSSSSLSVMCLPPPFILIDFVTGIFKISRTTRSGGRGERKEGKSEEKEERQDGRNIYVDYMIERVCNIRAICQMCRLRRKGEEG